MSEQIILFPFGGNAREAFSVIRDINTDGHRWDVVGFADHDESLHGKIYENVPIFSPKSIFKKFSDSKILVVPGNPQQYNQRKKIISDLNIPIDRFATIIHPTAVIAHNACIGRNVLIMPRVIVGCNSSVGSHVVILPNTVVSHDDRIGEYCCVGSNVSLSGHVVIGEQVYIASKTSVIDHVKIGDGTIVGIGSNVLKSLPARVVAAGNPCRILKGGNRVSVDNGLKHFKEKLDLKCADLELNLHGKVILTEAATGAYCVTPILAALAGATVYALARDSHYGTAQETVEFVKERASLWGDLPIHFLTELDPAILSCVDLVTNSGHLRPLDSQKLGCLKKGAVISLMYEGWEIRPSDVDLAFCREKNIPVIDINERHPLVGVFEYLADMVIKQILRSGLCLQGNRFVLLCNNEFASWIANKLIHLCRGVGVIGRLQDKAVLDPRVEFLSEFPECRIPQHFRDTSAVILSAYPFETIWVGDENSPVSLTSLTERMPFARFLKFCGEFDANFLAQKGVLFDPPESIRGHMGIIPSEIGDDPIIALQAGGLKAGECLLNGNLNFKGSAIGQIVRGS